VRLVVVSAYQQLVGGVETYLAWLLAALVERGHEVVFAFEHPTADEARALDRGIERLVRWDLSAMSRADFLGKLSTFAPDAIFLQKSEDERIDLEITARFRAVLFAHDFYGACATGWRVHRLPTRQICPRTFGPACLPINYLRGCGARNPVVLLKLYSKQRERSRILPRLAAIVVASTHMRAVYEQHGVPAQNIHVIPCPVQVPPDDSPPAPRELRNRVLFLGRLTSGKGGARAVQAVARCQRALGRPVHLTVAGEGPQLARCQRLARKLGVQAAFPGWVDAGQRLELLRSSDVLVVPSLWPEPFGIVGIEAGAVGLPAVAYGVGGITDWLRPGESGELAKGDSFTARALGSALTRVLQDSGYHQRLRVGAWRMSHEFSAERHISQLEGVLAKCVASNPRSATARI